MLNKYATLKHSFFKASKPSGVAHMMKWPYMGATPDGKVTCSCCGTGILEIKCPYCYRGKSIDVAAADKKFCLSRSKDGKIFLDHSQSYYYQVQTQLFVSDLEYSDFCVCTFMQEGGKDLNIRKDFEFWDECVKKATYFFKIMCFT